ncbi:Shedu anti-phage system protein SduA domain-containing protein [Xanthomonas euvesicatoria]|uniref:Shedu anti-phage system protein SduA domain-containing protein n=1 Tax=Xanthomonas euvesicatoria TaxID=456327 RepID=UPI000F8D5F27|nr:Shedu anti-phage system protein SduA domain-containing protein [Xanthomonas euvesicatoria]
MAVSTVKKSGKTKTKKASISKPPSSKKSSPVSMVDAGKFVTVTPAGIAKQWALDVADLEALLTSASSSGAGLDERSLLAWFGVSVERIALLAYSVFGFVPDAVAREMTLATFRADFAWVRRAKGPIQASTVCFVEFEAALPKTLFEKKKRNAPYFGNSFLQGFSQLVDWCTFGMVEAEQNFAVAQALNGASSKRTDLRYLLVAGLDDFLNENTRNRLNWWSTNITLGRGTDFKTYSAIVDTLKDRLETNSLI